MLKLSRLVISGLIILGLSGCGRPVDPNQLLLVMETVGDRDVSASQEGGQFSSKLLRATRGPVDRPGLKLLMFPLGLQAYKFTQQPSVESPDNEEFCVDSEGGRVCFDVAVHAYIDADLPDLKQRLIRFMQDYQLRRYSNQDDVLEAFIKQRFVQILRRPFVEFSASKKALYLMTHKSEINQYAKDAVNKEFEQYGIVFPMVSISSAMRVSNAQQQKMNDIVMRDFENRVIEIETSQIQPLDAQIADLDQAAKTEAAKIINEANASSIDVVTQAKQSRMTRFIDLLGKKNYVEIELLLTMTDSLKDGKTTIDIVPKDSTLIIGQQTGQQGNIKGVTYAQK